MEIIRLGSKFVKNLNTIRLVNANFKQGDLYITLTYKKATLVNEDRAKKDIDNYIKKLKRWFKKNRPNEEFKYIHVIDFVDDPKKSKRTRIHHHLIVSEMDRDVAEEKWDLYFRIFICLTVFR